MIYGKRKDLMDYWGISRNLDTAIEYLLKLDTSSFEKGRKEVDGERVFVNCMEYVTKDPSELSYEAHEEYLDIHVLLKGEEQIAVADIEDLEEFEREKENDYIGYKGQAAVHCPMDAENFLIVFPSDAHMVKASLHEPTFVHKLVVKVKVNP